MHAPTAFAVLALALALAPAPASAFMWGGFQGGGGWWQDSSDDDGDITLDEPAAEVSGLQVSFGGWGGLGDLKTKVLEVFDKVLTEIGIDLPDVDPGSLAGGWWNPGSSNDWDGGPSSAMPEPAAAGLFLIGSLAVGTAVRRTRSVRSR